MVAGQGRGPGRAAGRLRHSGARAPRGAVQQIIQAALTEVRPELAETPTQHLESRCAKCETHERPRRPASLLRVAGVEVLDNVHEIFRIIQEAELPSAGTVVRSIGAVAPAAAGSWRGRRAVQGPRRTGGLREPSVREASGIRGPAHERLAPLPRDSDEFLVDACLPCEAGRADGIQGLVDLGEKIARTVPGRA